MPTHRWAGRGCPREFRIVRPWRARKWQNRYAMIENLRAIRGVHRILMIVCAAIAAFVLAPDSVKMLRAAQNEASALTNTRWNEYQEFLRSKLQPAERSQIEPFTRAMQRLRVRFAPDLMLAGEPFYCDAPRPKGSSLSEIERFFSGPHWVQPIRIKTPEVIIEREMRDRLLPLQRNQFVSQTRLVPLDADLTPCGPYDEVQNFTRARIDFIVSADDGSPSQPRSIEVFFEPREPLRRDMYALQWLHTWPNAGDLIADSELFPALKVYWTDVAKYDPHTALQRLGEREAAAKGKLAFFGLALDRSAAGWISPIVLLLVLLFFVSHLRHARRVRKECDESAEAGSYPWVGVFRGAVGSVLAYASVSLLPVAALAWMLIRSQEDLLRQPWYATGLNLAVVLVSVWAGYELRLFRSALGATPPTERATYTFE